MTDLQFYKELLEAKMKEFVDIPIQYFDDVMSEAIRLQKIIDELEVKTS